MSYITVQHFCTTCHRDWCGAPAQPDCPWCELGLRNDMLVSAGHTINGLEAENKRLQSELDAMRAKQPAPDTRCKESEGGDGDTWAGCVLDAGHDGDCESRARPEYVREAVVEAAKERRLTGMEFEKIEPPASQPEPCDVPRNCRACSLFQTGGRWKWVCNGTYSRLHHLSPPPDWCPKRKRGG